MAATKTTIHPGTLTLLTTAITIETILVLTLQEVRATLLQVLALLTPEIKGLLAVAEEEDAKIKSRL
jgi:hypothetical protein